MATNRQERAAIKALQLVIIRGRMMAYENMSHASIADLLDRAEYLAGLLCNEKFTTEVFLDNLSDLAKLHDCGMALEVFESSLKSSCNDA